MGLIQKTIDGVALALCWFFGLFARPEPLPRITCFRVLSLDFHLAEARLHWDDGDVRNVYNDGAHWYYLGKILITSERLVNHLEDRLLKEQQRIEQRRAVGLEGARSAAHARLQKIR